MRLVNELSRQLKTDVHEILSDALRLKSRFAFRREVHVEDGAEFVDEAKVKTALNGETIDVSYQDGHYNSDNCGDDGFVFKEIAYLTIPLGDLFIDDWVAALIESKTTVLLDVGQKRVVFEEEVIILPQKTFDDFNSKFSEYKKIGFLKETYRSKNENTKGNSHTVDSIANHRHRKLIRRVIKAFSAKPPTISVVEISSSLVDQILGKK